MNYFNISKINKTFSKNVTHKIQKKPCSFPPLSLKVEPITVLLAILSNYSKASKYVAKKLR